MTQDSAAVAIDAHRHPMSASDVVDDASSPRMITTTSGSSSNGDVGGDDGSSPKSSSAISTTTSCCGGSSSSRSGSDDDDPSANAKVSTVINNGSKTLKMPPLSLIKQVVDHNGGQKGIASNNSVATSSTSIGGRLTFYKGNQLGYNYIL